MSTQINPWVKHETLPDGGGRFTLAPLSRGMGLTVGNSLRRVLLSSLSGWAVTAIRIDSVKHEFSAIPGVVEDVFDFLANLKRVVFTGGDSDVKTISISASAGDVTARSLVVDSSLSVVNPDVYLCHVQSGHFAVELDIRRGVGYETAEGNRLEGTSVDTIAVDSSFSPVLRVNHQVENIRVGKELGYDSLVLDVWTNASISPEQAVQDASQIIMSHFDLFSRMNQKPQGDLVSTSDSVHKPLPADLTIDELELSARSSNCLKRAGIETVAALLELDYDSLGKIKNFGKKSADEINERLMQFGLALKGIGE